MRRLVVALVTVVVASCGSESDPAAERLRAADARLAERPRDPRAQAGVIRAAYAGAKDHVDEVSGAYRPEARPFADRAAAVWPRYVSTTRKRPDSGVASLMSVVYADALRRPREAARAQRYATEARPSATAYVRLAYLYARAGDLREANIAGQKALELAEPSERGRVRATIRELRRRAR